VTKKIEQGLDTTEYLALWLTRRSAESGWVDAEWRTRFHDEVRSDAVVILPPLAEVCEIPRLLRDKQYADFRGDYTRGLSELLQVGGVLPVIDTIIYEPPPLGAKTSTRLLIESAT
jgi:hypothetical protein